MKNEQHEARESNLPMKLSAPAKRALAGAGIHQLEQLTRFKETEIKKLHGIGPNALRQLRSALDETGLSFAEEARGNELELEG